MTLIDVDTLKQYIGDCKCCDKCPNKGRKQYECYYECNFPDYLTKEWERVLDEQPTVDAIPVQWLRKKQDEHSNDGFEWLFEEIINEWEQENQNDNN